jgi:hypothetical protein
MYGTQRRVYRPGEASTGILPFGTLAVTLLCLIVDTMDEGEHRAIVIACGLIGIVFFTWWHVVARSVLLTTYDEGFMYQSKARKFSVRWADIESLKYRAVQFQIYFSPVATSRRLRITERNGRTRKLGNSIKDSGDFAAELIACTQPRLVRKVAGELAAGCEVSFGPIRLSASAVSGPRLLGRRIIPMGQLQSHVFRDGRLTVKGKDGEFVVPVSSVSNVSVLSAFLTASENSPAV